MWPSPFLTLCDLCTPWSWVLTCQKMIRQGGTAHMLPSPTLAFGSLAWPSFSHVPLLFLSPLSHIYILFGTLIIEQELLCVLITLRTHILPFWPWWTLCFAFHMPSQLAIVTACWETCSNSRSGPACGLQGLWIFAIIINPKFQEKEKVDDWRGHAEMEAMNKILKYLLLWFKKQKRSWSHNLLGPLPGPLWNELYVSPLSSLLLWIQPKKEGMKTSHRAARWCM